MNFTIDKTELHFCSDNSLSKNEPLPGSAPKTDLWIALEYPHPPGDNALRESTLSDEIKAHLTTLQKTIEYSRLLLIRNQHTHERPTHSLFIAYSNRSQPCLYEIQLEDYMQLVSINADSIHSEIFPLPYRLMGEPLFLICTNGRRDPCCAKWGLPLYNALEKVPGISVWQTSHVGGHRFAGNMICLPHGIYYGRVSPDNATTIVEHYQAGLIDLDRYRGRASLSSIAQVGEYFLRQQTADLQVDSIQFKTASEINPDQWEVSYTSNLSKNTYRLMIASELSDQMIFESCSTPDELKPIKRFRLIDFTEDKLRR